MAPPSTMMPSTRSGIGDGRSNRVSSGATSQVPSGSVAIASSPAVLSARSVPPIRRQPMASAIRPATRPRISALPGATRLHRILESAKSMGTA